MELDKHMDIMVCCYMKVWVLQTNRAYRDTLGCFSISKVVLIYDFILFFKNIFNDNQVLLDIL